VKTLLLFTLLAQAAAGAAEQHKTWMNDASDLQEDVRDALAAGSGEKAAEAASKIEGLMDRTGRYWADRRQADIVKLAAQTGSLARQLAAEAGAGRTAQASDAFARMNASCNTCHDAHPEKR
jgi:hypothetical protein